MQGKKLGRGVAGGFWFNGTGPASAIVSVLADGTVSLVEGSPDIGGSRAVAAMHVAEVLGLAAEDVNPSVGGHQFHRLDFYDRRQRRGVQDGVGVLRGGAGCEGADGGAGGPHLGH